jgi:hypothetical protein
VAVTRAYYYMIWRIIEGKSGLGDDDELNFGLVSLKCLMNISGFLSRR